METVYVPVEAATTYTRSVPSDADVTSGYYLSYIPTADGGFTGISWCLEDLRDPFEGFDFKTALGEDYREGSSTEECIVQLYTKEGSLNKVFSSWGTRVLPKDRSNFCNELMNSAYGNSGCITLP